MLEKKHSLPYQPNSINRTVSHNQGTIYMEKIDIKNPWGP